MASHEIKVRLTERGNIERQLEEGFHLAVQQAVERMVTGIMEEISRRFSQRLSVLGGRVDPGSQQRPVGSVGKMYWLSKRFPLEHK